LETGGMGGSSTSATVQPVSGQSALFRWVSLLLRRDRLDSGLWVTTSGKLDLLDPDQL
jgi:hypothetical protein